MITKLTNIELNVLAVALDHMEEHLLDIQVEGPGNTDINWFDSQDRLEAVKTLQTKLL
jgi:hypothetical protein